MLICEIRLFVGIFLNSANLICKSMDISKCFRGSLRLRDNESRLYMPLRKIHARTTYSLQFVVKVTGYKIKFLPSFFSKESHN